MKKIKYLLGRLSRNSVFQTISGFLGFLLAAAIIMLVLESTEIDSGINSFFQSLWFSIVTVTTVGYGDLSPLSAIGKIAAIVIMFIGVAYVGVLTGNITSWLVERNRKRTFGLVPIRELKGHILICGWKQGMSDVVKGILNLNNKQSSDIVLVNNVEAQEVNELRQDPKLRDFHFFSGDYTTAEVLANTCAQHAEKALIIAEEHTGKPVNEIDFETVLTAIAIKRLNPEVYTTVEIVDSGFQHYLQNVETEEILLNRYYARALMCTMSLMSGVNAIFKSFFSLESGILKIQDVSQNDIGKLYSELKCQIEDVFVIGVLENVGNLRHRKRDKMTQIQKSVTINDAIKGLIEIKKMESNIPVLHPAPSYVIKENSALIVLNRPANGLNDQHPNEQGMDERTRQTSKYELAQRHIQRCVSKSANWEEFLDYLSALRMETYEFSGKIEGIVYQNEKISFSALPEPGSLERDVNSIQKKRKKTELVIFEKVERFLKEASSWREFYSWLEQENFLIYQYRQKPYGIKFNSKNYSFKTLGFSKELVAQLEQHDVVQKQSGQKASALPSGDIKGVSLQDFYKRYLNKQLALGKGKKDQSGLLMICGWKPQLVEMLSFIVSQHENHNTTWNRIVVVADLSEEDQNDFKSYFNVNSGVDLVVGDFVDRKTLRAAGIHKARKVIILAQTESSKSFEEIDAQTVLAAMLIGSMNKQAYKIAEILDKRYEDALERANVEEVFLEDEFLQVMLVNGTRGLGITRVLGQIFNLDQTLLSISDIEPRFVHQSFYDLYKNSYSSGKLILGLVEDTGNIYARKSEKIVQAQIQSNIKGQVEELIKVKSLVPNKIIIAPPRDYRINPNSRLIVLDSNQRESWRNYRDLVS